MNIKEDTFWPGQVTDEDGRDANYYDQETGRGFHVVQEAGGVYLAGFGGQGIEEAKAKIYGEGAKPHTLSVYSSKATDELLNTNFQKCKENLVGAIILWNSFYINTWFPTGKFYDYPMYEYADPDYIRGFVTAAHAEGIKVVCYLRTPALDDVWTGASTKDIFIGLLVLMLRNRLDGCYGDNFYCGSLRSTIAFLKELRKVSDQLAANNGFDRGAVLCHSSYSMITFQRQAMAPWAAWELCDWVLLGESLRPKGAGMVPQSMTDEVFDRYGNCDKFVGIPWCYKHKPERTTPDPDVYPWDFHITEDEYFEQCAEAGILCRLISSNPNDDKFQRIYMPIFRAKKAEYLKERARE